MTIINRLDAQQYDFEQQLSALLHRTAASGDAVAAQVDAIIDAVKTRGDAALLEYTQRFDRLAATHVDRLAIPIERCEQALQRMVGEQRQALEFAAERIRAYHQRQKQESWSYCDADGTVLGQQVTALERVGIYVPGGKASYPSSVLMNALPAQIAGVDEIVMVVPAPDGEISDWVLAAAKLAGVHRIFTIGGAQAIAALAFGTETIPRVDKIVGPGNQYVACAKRKVFGLVGLDMVAGPSEIAIICDGQTEPDWVAMDLLSQAEHDEDAQAILLCPDEAFFRSG